MERIQRAQAKPRTQGPVSAAEVEEILATNAPALALLLLDTALRHVDAGTNGLPMAIRGEFQFCSGILRDLHAGRIPADRMIDNSAAISYLNKFGVPQYLLKPNETRLLFASGCRETIRNVRHLYRDMRFRDSDGELARAARRRLLWRGNAVGENLRDDGGSKRDSRTNAETENSRHMLDYVIAVPAPCVFPPP